MVVKTCCICSRWGKGVGARISSVSALSFAFFSHPPFHFSSCLLALLSIFSLSMRDDNER